VPSWELPYPDISDLDDFHLFLRWDTVDVRNPAPPGMYKTLQNPASNGISYQPQVVRDL